MTMLNSKVSVLPFHELVKVILALNLTLGLKDACVVELIWNLPRLPTLASLETKFDRKLYVVAPIVN